MAWETRNGRTYYYRSVREGSHVRKEYVGGGEVAGAIAALDAYDRQDREMARFEAREHRAAMEALETQIAELDRSVTAAVEQALTAAGYHRHKRGEWRRKRERKRRERERGHLSDRGGGTDGD